MSDPIVTGADGWWMDKHYYRFRDFNISQLKVNIWDRIPEERFAVICSVCVLTTLVAIFGNVTLIVIVSVTKTLRNCTNFFIINMAVSDMLLVLCCTPMYIVSYSHQQYIMGSVACKIQPLLEVCFMLASGLSIVVISIDRLYGIVYPFSPKLSDRFGILIIIMIWILSFAFALPQIWLRKYGERQWKDYLERFCGDDWENTRIYWAIVLIVAVYLPMISVITAYIAIIRKLDKYDQLLFVRRAHPNKAKARRKIVRMLFVILLVHFICWLPFQIIILYRSSKGKSDFKEIGHLYQALDFIAHYLAYTNGASNPFIYGASNKNKIAFLKNCPCLRRSNRIQPLTDPVQHEMVNRAPNDPANSNGMSSTKKEDQGRMQHGAKNGPTVRFEEDVSTNYT
ncbi:Uncharacterised protein g10745 [Pycnogonum litorale]